MFESIEAVREQIRNVRNRVLNTIDAFRPKIIFKEPLTELLPQAERVSAEALLERLQRRVEQLRSGIGGQAGEGQGAAGLIVTKDEKRKRTGVIY